MYLTRTGSKYHNANCRCLPKSKIPTKPSYINHEKYHPCSVCKPSIQVIIQNLINKNCKIIKTFICLFMVLLFVGGYSLPAEAPVYKTYYIAISKPCYIYNIQDPMLRAFIQVESGFNPEAVNPISGARGILQYLPIMIEEVNKICVKKNIPKKFTWEDAWDPYLSIDIWYIVQNYHNPEYDIQKACRIWFGVGVQYDGLTWVGYHKEVLKYLI